jgi:ribosomal protein S18 acetylase RimI-like enzyme
MMATVHRVPVMVTEAGITVRLARPQELAAAGAVVRLAYETDGHHGEYLDVIADTRDRSRDAEIVVAVEGTGQVLGCVTFVLPGSRWAELSRPGEAEFRMLGVHPEARRRGAGLALTSWCIERARAAGARRLLLGSLPSMTSAHRIYQGLGFRRQPQLDFSPVPDVALLGFELPLRGASLSTDTERAPVSSRRRLS